MEVVKIILDFVKLVLMPIIKFFERQTDKNDYKLKQLQRIRNENHSQLFCDFLTNTEKEICFRQQTNVNTNHQTVDKMIELYNRISMNTKENISVLKKIEEFIDISGEKATIRIPKNQKVLGIILYRISIFGNIICFILALISLLFLRDWAMFIEIVALIVFFMYFLYTTLPLKKAIWLQKIVD